MNHDGVITFFGNRGASTNPFATNPSRDRTWGIFCGGKCWHMSPAAVSSKQEHLLYIRSSLFFFLLGRTPYPYAHGSFTGALRPPSWQKWQSREKRLQRGKRNEKFINVSMIAAGISAVWCFWVPGSNYRRISRYEKLSLKISSLLSS